MLLRILKTLALILAVGCAEPAHSRTFFKSGFERPTDLPASDAEAARFLEQATFGPTQADVDLVRKIGYSNWIWHQTAATPTLTLPYLEGLVVIRRYAGLRLDRWLHTAVTAPDQLRQRVAFALSEIFVISDEHPQLINDPGTKHVAYYSDILVRDAFSTYATVLRDVTYDVAMGVYLSHFRNRKPAPGRDPDENYAREVMQLFSIGLVELNLDGSPMLDAQGNPIPTYDQNTVTATARVFTGFTYGNAGNDNFYTGNFATFAPMKCMNTEHDNGAKTVVGDVVLPAGRNCANDVGDLLNLLAAHPNTAPFLARLLIQRFTTSNPSPAYIRRVAQAFNNNGDGERGDLVAVVRQILLDPEARAYPAPARFGKIREPIVQLAAVLRAWPFLMPAPDPVSGILPMTRRSKYDGFLQIPLSAPSVFNFFLPDYMAPGIAPPNALYSPEMQIYDESTTFSNAAVLTSYTSVTSGEPRPYIDLTAMAALPDDDARIAQVDRSMFFGTMPAGMREILRELMSTMRSGNASALDKSMTLIQIASMSPEFTYQH